MDRNQTLRSPTQQVSPTNTSPRWAPGAAKVMVLVNAVTNVGPTHVCLFLYVYRRICRCVCVTTCVYMHLNMYIYHRP